MVLAGMAATAQADVIEDFEDGDVSDYVLTGPIGLFETSPAAAHDGDLGLANNNSSGWAYRDDAGVQLVQGDTVSFWLNLGPKPGGRAYFGFGATAAGTMSLVAAPNTGDIRFQANPGYGFIELNSSPQVWEANKWYRLEVIWGVGGLLEGNLYDSDGETLLGCDSGVTNVLFEDGCTMSDLIAQCAEEADNHGQFVSCVAHLALDWARGGLIDKRRVGKIVSCAAMADLPSEPPGSSDSV
jgi:hypothetical protein